MIPDELQFLTTGIYVLTVAHGGVRHGMSSSWVAQASGEPPLVSVSVDKRHRSHGLVAGAGRFALNVVGRRAKRLEDYFYSSAAKAEDNLAPFALGTTASGVPWLHDALAAIELVVEAAHDAGDHTLFLCRPGEIHRGAADQPLSSLDLDYVYLGTGKIIRREGRGS